MQVVRLYDCVSKIKLGAIEFMNYIHKTTLAVAQIVYLCLGSAAVAETMPNGAYTETDFGEIELNCHKTEGVECTGTYEGGQSFIYIDSTDEEGVYLGYWAEPASDQPCAQTTDFDDLSTKAWGTIDLYFDTSHNSWTGAWGYCNDPQTGQFNGARGDQPAAVPVFAAVTSQSVWDSLNALVAANPELTITNYTIKSQTADGGFTVTVPEIVIEETDDSVVTVTLSDKYSVNLTSTNAMGKATDITMLIRQPGMTLVVYGDDTDRTYDFFAPTSRITMAKKTLDGVPVDILFDLAFRGVDGSFKFEGSDIQTVSSRLVADVATIDIEAADQNGTGTTKLQASLSDLKSSFESSADDAFYTMTMAESLAAGFKVGGVFSHGALTYDLSTQDEGTGGFASSGAIASGKLDLAMGKDRLTYSGNTKGVEFEVSGAAIPLPLVNIALEEAGFDVLMPITQSDVAEDFGLLIKLVRLSASDDIWNTFDPTSLFPRDPATLVLDLVGKGNWLVDIFEPEVAAAMSDATTVNGSGEIQSLTLNEMTVRLAGADLHGTGDFTFDNTDLTTFDGFPKPTGAIDLKLIGGNGLLDKLIALEMLPEEGATSARMMMGLFARIVEGTEDTMTSQIEIKEDGSVMANGQRLR
jgi:hypothetical protein